MPTPALAVMCRFPSPQGKSRLGDVLTPDQREDLQWALLLDTLDKVRQLPRMKCYIAATPAHRLGDLRKAAGAETGLIAQPEGDLGRRMLGVIQHLFSLGHTPVILIGADIPTMPLACILRALELLDRSSLVLGPAEDGGYYLIGMSYPEGRVFEDINWGTASVLRKTLEICDMNKLSCSLLGSLRDIDVAADLAAVADEIKKGEGEQQPVPLRTVNFLQQYFSTKG